MNQYFKSKNKELKYSNNMFELDIFYITYAKQSPFHSYSQKVLHKHPYYEICCVLNGECEFEIYNKKSLTVSKNRFIIFPPMCEHRIINESESFSKISSLFSFIPKENDKNNFYIFAKTAMTDLSVYKNTNNLNFYLKRFIEIFNSDDIKDYDTSLLSNFISFIIEIFQTVTFNKNISVQHIYTDKRINDALTYIEKNITDSLTVEDVASHIHLSSKQLSRLFEKHLSVTPGKYIRNVKIKKIRQLLINDEYSLYDIAEIMKYNDTSALIKFFKKSEGITPQKLRNRI